jgi:AraC family transcriptional activator FtrA
VEQIATRVGFNSAVVMREHFRREIGLAPVDYRRRFVMPRSPVSADDLELSA